MQLESIRIKNFKAFKDTTIENIPKFLVVVGANGAGKTTLFDVFGFLRDCLIYNVSCALQSRGGFREVVTRGCEAESIIIELQYRMTITNKDRLVTYMLEIAYEKGSPVVQHEVLRYKRGPYGKPYHFLRISRGAGYAITNEEDFDKVEELTREEQMLEGTDILAIKGLGQFQRFKAANAFRQLLENWHVSEFHIEMARGGKDAAGYAVHLSVTGDNLQLVANNLFRNHRDTIFARIVDTMKRRVPGISAINPIESPDGRLLLGFQDGSFKDPFIDRYVSDDTMKMFAYLVLLHDPKLHPLLCIEEPGNQLYPTLLVELAEEFRSYALRGGQVFVSTHSPDFLNACSVEEVYWLAKEGGHTQVKRAAEDAQIVDYMREAI